jgi:hypothetical protein
MGDLEANVLADFIVKFRSHYVPLDSLSLLAEIRGSHNHSRSYLAKEFLAIRHRKALRETVFCVDASFDMVIVLEHRDINVPNYC